MRVKFTKSSVGRFGLGYLQGQVAELDDKRAKELIAAGYAQEVGKEDQGKPSSEQPKRPRRGKTKK